MKKTILTCLALFALLLISKNAFAQYTIPSNLFGINGWMNSYIGDGTNVYNCNGLSTTYSASTSPAVCYLNGKVESIMSGTCCSIVKDLHVNLIRYGGKSNDINFPTYDQFINEIDRIRALGAEPIIQIPYYKGRWSATDASNLLTYLKNAGKNVKYIEIGNEPDQYSGYSLATYASDFRSIATALKAVDNTIQIIGPSYSEYKTSDYAALLGTGSNSIVGVDGNGNFYLDIVDVHRYPFDGNPLTQTRANIIDDPANATGTYTTATCFASILTNTASAGLLDYVSAANGNRSGNPLQFSVSEMNIDWQNPSVNTYTTMGTAGFIAGQWMADMYSVILEKARTTGVDVAFIAPWSMQESGGPSGLYDYGVFDNSSACTPGKRSTYEHLSAMGKYFKGDFYMGTNNSKPNVKQFGTVQTNGDYVIMLVNEDATNSYSYTINTGSVTTGSGSLVVTMNMTHSNTAYTYTTGIAAKATHLIFFDCNRTFVKTMRYDEGLAGSQSTFTVETGSGNLPVLLTTSSSNTGCSPTYSATGSATVSATGGTGSYTYTWSPAGYTGGNTATYSNLPAGTYTVSVSSGTVCTAPQTAIVTIASGSPLVTITTPTNANSCASSATFTVAATGGTSPYTYVWQSNTSTTTVSNAYTQPAGHNNAVTYTVSATDAHGCASTATFAHYSTHTVSLSTSPTTSANACCTVSLTCTYIPGAWKYTWAKVGSTPTFTTATNTFVYGWGYGVFTATVSPGNLDPCGAVVTPNYTITNAGGNSCNCPQGPFGRLAGSPSSSSEIIALVPNPANSTTTVQISLESFVKTARLIITDVFGKMIASYSIRTDQTEAQLDCQSLRDGLYFCSLVADDTPVSVKKLMVVK